MLSEWEVGAGNVKWVQISLPQISRLQTHGWFLSWEVPGISSDWGHWSSHCTICQAEG